MDIVNRNYGTLPNSAALNDGAIYDAQSQLENDKIMEEIMTEFDLVEVEGDLFWRRADQFKQWREWYIENYLNIKPVIKARSDNENVDLRVLFLAHPIPGYAILCFLESCFEVDKAICGPDTAALASIRMWHIPNQMNAYKYILSGELLLWWKKELCELQNEINSSFSNLISVEIRVHDLTLATAQLVKAVQSNSPGFPSIYNRVCERLLDDGELRGEFPSHLMDCIFAREHLLITSLEILGPALQQRKERRSTTAPFSLPEAHIDREEGLRRRIPRAASAASAEGGDEGSRETPSHISEHENDVSNMSRLLEGSHHAVREGILPSSKSFRSWQPFEQAAEYFDLVKRLVKARKFLKFLIHQETCAVIFSSLVAASAVCMALSYRSPSNPTPSACQESFQTDSSFYANISQGILSILTVYLTILPTLRSKTLGLRYRFWFWTCLSTSAVLSILSLGLYARFPLVSGVIGWISTFTQVILTLLLTLSIQKASEEGSIDGIELHRN